MAKKLTKTQKRNLLMGAHRKFLKLFREQQLGENFIDHKDLQEILKIVNRINQRMLK